jgi:hypothetical protein
MPGDGEMVCDARPLVRQAMPITLTNGLKPLVRLAKPLRFERSSFAEHSKRHDSSVA